MITSILFFLVISSGSVTGAAFFRKRFEGVLPITVSLIIIVQYIFALFGQLRFGAYFVFIASFSLLCFAVIKIIAKHQIMEFVTFFFTPGFAIALAVYILVNIANIGKLAYSWDEFTHWADVVKAMVTMDDLATNPASQSLFKSYPPAMPLFQYNMQVLNQVVTGSAAFVEWRLYLCYHFATYSYLIYFAKDLSWHRIGRVFAFASLLILLPSMFFGFFDTLYIDAFLGVLAGCALMYCLVVEKMGKYHAMLILLALVCLVLTKDVGMYFALFVGLVFVYRVVSQSNGKERLHKSHLFSLLVAVAVFGAKFSWSSHLASREVGRMFGQAISMKGFFDVLFHGSSADYRWVTLHNFWRALYERRLRLGSTFISIPVFLIILLLLVGIMISMTYGRKLQKKCFPKYTGVIVFVFSGLYLIGMCIMYMYKFSEYEAVRLASMERYISILITMLSITLLLTLLNLTSVTDKGGMRLLVVSVALLLCPVGPVRAFISGRLVSASIAARAQYNKSVELVNHAISGSPARIWIISQEDTGFDYYVLRYSLKPNIVDPAYNWSIGEPFYEGDIWTLNITANGWMNSLRDTCDYVLLYKTNAFFVEEFGELFENPASIRNNQLYRVDAQNSLLIEASNP